MRRPAVSVVVPFAGDRAAAEQAISMMCALRAAPGDQLILSDNSSAAVPNASIEVVRATGERSPAHARNVGAARASGEWILFLDADTRAPADLLDRYFEPPPGEGVGALAGEIRPAAAQNSSLAARYAAHRNFLSARAHLGHPYRPRAAAANLMVRRIVFEALGGFREGVRAGEDTDLCWRLQELGWALEIRGQAAVEHAYRDTVRELRAQWRGYAAGRAWLARNHPGFHPEPALARALRRLRGGHIRNHEADSNGSTAGAGAPAGPGGAVRTPNQLEHAQFLALDALLAVEELIGLHMSNRPPKGRLAR
jgi:hypothetical protein